MIFNDKLIKQKCQKLADDIADKYPLDGKLYNAFTQIPREIFVPNGMGRHAYTLDALPMQKDQWISSPLTVAKMSMALELNGVDNVLEIGCGSGYQACILSKIVRRVFSIERIQSLLELAKQRFHQLNIDNIHVRFDDGQKGWRSYAPYDRILFSASPTHVSDVVFSQLKVGGILVVPLQIQNKQIITQFIKTKNGIEKKVLDECFFVPVQNGTQK